MAAFGGAARDLVGSLGNGVADSAPTQRGPGGIVRVRLVGDQHVRPLAGPAGPRMFDADGVEEIEQLRIVADLARGEQDRQRPPASIYRDVDLRRQPSAGPSERFTVHRRDREAAGAPFFRAPAACWCARTTDESTLITHSTG
jgi:hypothetical protein